MTSARELSSSPGASVFSARFKTYLAGLNRAQKSGAGVPAYTRWINRRLARRVAAAAAAAGLGPNAVTAISTAVSALGLVLLVILNPSIVAGVVVAAVLAGGYVLDSADGQVARLIDRSSPAGEWLDHVVDAMRTPAIHLVCAVAVYLHRGGDVLLMSVALAFAVLSAGQFMSQILAGQLSDHGGGSPTESSEVGKSFFLIPTDTGTLCWLFACWGLGPVFAIGYVGLFLLNTAHGAVSMRRKYVRLRDLEPRVTTVETATSQGD